MARPTIINSEVTAAICTMLRGGVPIRHAAQANGVSESSYHNWRERGRDAVENGTGLEPAEAPYVEFVELTDKARSEAVAAYAMKLRELALAGDGQSVRFFLSHSDREHWHPQTVGEVAVDGEIHVKLEWPD